MCPRFRAYHSRPRKNRHIDRPVSSLPGDIRRGTDLSAARFYGHTPRKLPVFTAISRIIAECTLTGALISYNNTPVCVKNFFKKFLHGFYGDRTGEFGHNPLWLSVFRSTRRSGQKGRAEARPSPSTLYRMGALTGAQGRCSPAPAAARPPHRRAAGCSGRCGTTRCRTGPRPVPA